jgi:hypothetical protein
VLDLYAITDAPGPPPDSLQPLRVVPSGRLAIVCAPAAAGEVTAEALWRHEEAVEALMEEHDVLPFRYGTRCEDEAAAAVTIQAREPELVSALERVRGAVELSVRVMAPTPLAARGASPQVGGAEYLAVKEHESAAMRAAAERVHAPLAALARASRRRAGGEPGELLRSAYLVERASVDDFAAEVARLQGVHGDLQLLCTGPWPPYSFAQP